MAEENPITRDEFEDVKQLLATAARYAETGNRKFDQLTERLDTFVFESQRLLAYRPYRTSC
jgi:hypothetical protein